MHRPIVLSYIVGTNFNFVFISAFGDTFAGIGVREPQPRASEAFRTFGDQHRQMEKAGIKMLQAVKPVSSNCNISFQCISVLISILLHRFSQIWEHTYTKPFRTQS
jgi:hypothetical protein